MDKDKDKVSLESLLDDEATPEVKKDAKSTDLNILKKLWDAESPKKTISSYSEHTLNWDGADSTGKIIRGLEGIFTNLDRAVIDVVAGTIQKIAELFQRTNKEDEQRR